MRFIPGDIVRYKNKNTLYRVELPPDGKLCLRYKESSRTYTIPPNADNRMIKDSHDTTYRVPRDNIRAYMKRVSSDRASPEMRAFVDNRMGPHDHRMDTSGFDALKSASNNDAIDAMADYCKKDVIMADKMMRHGKNYDMGTERLSEALLGKYAGETNILNKLKAEDKMININGLIAKVTNNIKDAELVTKYFGHELREDSIKDKFFVRDNYKKLLEEANAREKKRLEAEKLCA